MFLIKFLAHVTRVLPKLYLRSRDTPKSREHALGMSERVIVQNMGLRYGTARNLRTIAILPMQSRSQKLTVRDWNLAQRVQIVTRTVIPGVQTPKMGIRSGHRRITNTRQDDVESKILD